MAESNAKGRPSITVTLTSYPARITIVNRIMENMQRQTMQPDRVVLWLALSQFPHGEEELPYSLTKHKRDGLEIRWCDDTRSYKKLIPALLEFPDDILITLDDDLVYDDRLIESLYASYCRHPNAISAARTHLMRFDGRGELLPYRCWRMDYSGIIDTPSMALFATTGAGTLFPPHIFGEEAVCVERALRLCPKADDVWVKVMQLMYNVPTVLARENRPLRYIPASQLETLYSYNLEQDGNDVQLAAAIEYYDNAASKAMLKQRLCECNTGLKPELTVIVPDAENGRPLIESLLGGSMYGVEVTAIHRADSAATQSAYAEDVRYRETVVDPDSTDIERIAAAAEKAQGEYVLIAGAGDSISLNSLRTIYRELQKQSADIMHVTCEPCEYADGIGLLPDYCFEQPQESVTDRERLISEYFQMIGCGDGEEKKVYSPALCGKVFRTELLRGAVRRLCGVRVCGEDADRLIFAAALSDCQLLYRREMIGGWRFGGCSEDSADIGRLCDLLDAADDVGALFADKTLCDSLRRKLYQRAIACAVNCPNISDAVALLCDRLGKPETLAALSAAYRGRENELVGLFAGDEEQCVCISLPRCIGIYANEDTEGLPMLIEACAGVAADVLLLTEGWDGSAYASERVSCSDVSGVQLSERLAVLEKTLSERTVDLLCVRGTADNELLAMLLLLRSMNIPVILQTTGSVIGPIAEGCSTPTAIIELIQRSGAVSAYSDEDEALLRLLDVRTRLCGEDRLEHWKTMLQQICTQPTEPKEQPLRRAIKALMNHVSDGLAHNTAQSEDNRSAAAVDYAKRLFDSGRRTAVYMDERIEEQRSNAAQKLENTIKDIRKLDHEEDERSKKILRLEVRDEMDALRQELNEQRRQTDAARREFEQLRESSIYKAGRYVTYVPRKLRELVRSILERSNQ